MPEMLIRPHDNISGLQVLMNDSVTVCFVQGAQNLLSEK